MPNRFAIDGKGFLRFEPWLAQPWLEHGFSTIAAGDFREFTRTRELAHELGFEAAALRQVHSDTVIVVDGAPAMVAKDDRPEADALVTAQPGVLVAVRTADCVPILLLDPERRAVAAVHAGWRGSAARIAERAVQRMTQDLGAAAGSLQAVIGPCIGTDSYEVGPEVAAQFDPADVTAKPREHVDLAAANRRQLLAGGLAAENVHVAAACTYSEANLYHSHRRDAERSGRMIHFIGIRGSASRLP